MMITTSSSLPQPEDTRVRISPRMYPLTQARATAKALTIPQYLEKLVEEDNVRDPLTIPNAPAGIKSLDPDECLRLSQWFDGIGGAKVFPTIYANPETQKRAALKGFIDYLATSKRTRFRKGKMSTNEKTGWRLQYIEQQYLAAKAAGRLASINLEQLEIWAAAATRAFP